MIVGLNGVSKRFVVGEESVIALDQANFGVIAGEFACVYGASGSGKTTLLNVLACITRVDSGSVFVCGEDVTDRSESYRAGLRLRHIGVVFQSNNLLPEFTARENVALPLLVRGESKAAANVAADSALTSVDLLQAAHRLPKQMSGGQRQRVGIARALAGNQEVILADEPTGALDSENSRQLFALLRVLCDEARTAVVVATHDPLAMDFADVVYDMVDGRLGRR
jgi:putative ABC transport system ATP-binding protein